MSIIDILKEFWQHYYHHSLFYQFATTVINEFGRLGCPIGRSGMLTFTEILQMQQRSTVSHFMKKKKKKERKCMKI